MRREVGFVGAGPVSAQNIEEIIANVVGAWLRTRPKTKELLQYILSFTIGEFRTVPKIPNKSVIFKGTVPRIPRHTNYNLSVQKKKKYKGVVYEINFVECKWIKGNI